MLSEESPEKIEPVFISLTEWHSQIDSLYGRVQSHYVHKAILNL